MGDKMLSEISISSLKNCHQIREYEEKKAKERRKNILCLISQYLRDEGFTNTWSTLQSEYQSIRQYELCDNVDLSTIVQEFESYYYIRFQKYPKICKKICDEDCMNLKKVQISKPKKPAQDGIPQKYHSMTKLNEPGEKPGLTNLGALKVVPLGRDRPADAAEEKGIMILKPISGLGNHDPEWMGMAEIITKEIIVKDLNVHWDDIQGHYEAKRLLKEAVVYPTKYPELFSGILSPWRGLLLFGPSGTGKTMLAKAVATECKTTFFNITSSSIVSKWRGDSEKLVRVMFELARYYAPSTIFIDEIDAIASKRGGYDIGREHEASRRLKTELLIQIDGLSRSHDQVFLLATSNLPWELDPALLRRLEKRILVGPPNLEAREAMFKNYLPKVVLKQPSITCNMNYLALAKDTEGYTGADIYLICKEAAMQAVRNVLQVLDESQERKNLSNVKLEPITTVDVLFALEKTKPSGSANHAKYDEWYEKFGSY